MSGLRALGMTFDEIVYMVWFSNIENRLYFRALFALDRPERQILETWLDNNGVTDADFGGSSISFKNEEDAMLCLLAFR